MSAGPNDTEACNGWEHGPTEDHNTDYKLQSMQFSRVMAETIACSWGGGPYKDRQLSIDPRGYSGYEPQSTPTNIKYQMKGCTERITNEPQTVGQARLLDDYGV